MLHIIFAKIAGVSTDFFGKLTGVFLHLVSHRFYRAFVIAILGYIRCYYHLRLIVNCCIRESGSVKLR